MHRYIQIPTDKMNKKSIVRKSGVAKSDNFCLCGCEEKISSGQDIIILSWGHGVGNFIIVKPEHDFYDRLPAASQCVWWEMKSSDRHRNDRYRVYVDDEVVYYTGQKERAKGVVEYLASQGMVDESDAT